MAQRPIHPSQPRGAIHGALVCLALLAAAPASAQEEDHPLAECAVSRTSFPVLSSLSFSCPPLQIGVRRFSPEVERTAVVEQFKGELTVVAEALESTLVWNEGQVTLADASRDVAQYTFRGKEGGIQLRGLVVPDGTSIWDCSSSNPEAAEICPAALDAIIRLGLPSGVRMPPFAEEIRTAEVLDTKVKVPLGCRTGWLLDEAMHVSCADAALFIGLTEVIGGLDIADPAAQIRERIRAGEGLVEKEAPCAVGGGSATCWTGSARVGGIRQTAWTSQLVSSGKAAVFACTWTASSAPHPLCAPFVGE